MVRPADGIDLGQWDVPARALLIPVDTHIHKLARNLALTDRDDLSWKTAEEITSGLRRFDLEDPRNTIFRCVISACCKGVHRAAIRSAAKVVR